MTQQHLRPEIAYQESVKGCAFLLEEELLKTNSAEAAEAMTRAAVYHARTTYCKHLCMMMHEQKTFGFFTRRETVRDSLRDIVKQEKRDTPSHILFRAMYAAYSNKGDNPFADRETDLDYMEKGAFGAVANLFYAAANEDKTEEKYLDFAAQPSCDGRVQKMSYF